MKYSDIYLKDGVSFGGLSSKMSEYIEEQWKGTYVPAIAIVDFFMQPVKPSLTEDEKVILRNINDSYTTISRTEYGALIITYPGCTTAEGLFMFKNVFDWIQPGEEYKISDLLGDE